ncbi:MAG: patatin-like phospholipase family protein [Granulosicoccus sp.]
MNSEVKIKRPDGEKKSSKSPMKRINLALQGGGSHGAFTWGVLDRLLEEPNLLIDAISGTSAGAMNAVVLADGFTRCEGQGRAAASSSARQQLETFWRAVSNAAQGSIIQRTPINRLLGNWSLSGSWGYHFSESLSRLYSPYQTNPLNINPLKGMLESVVDFDSVNKCNAVKLFISATNVHTGRVKVFDSHQLSSDIVLASACLPQLFQAVEIDGIPYWDGGYMGNPSLFPFRDHTETADIVVVQINPVERLGTPKSPQEIQNRLNEINFNSSLLKELRAIEFVSRLLDEGKLDEAHYRRERIHIIENQDALIPLGASSKLNAEWEFLQHLRDIGRETADSWIENNFDQVGVASTVDLPAMFNGTGPARPETTEFDL